MAELKEGLIGGAVNLYFIYKFLRILTTPWEKSEAFKLGIVDDNGKILKKKRTLKTSEEKESYTMMHRLVWKLKRLMEKVPFGKSRLASYAAALWLIKEHKFQGTDEQLQESFLTFLETDWKNDALILKENHEGDMDKKTFSRFKAESTIEEKLVELNEALKPIDKSVIDAFYYKKEKEGKLVSTDGDSLWKNGMGGQEMAYWKGRKIKITGATDSKSTESILKYMKKSIPSGLLEAVEIEEKKSATGYELYHKDFSSAMQHAVAHAKSKGFVVDPKEIDDKVATGPKKPSSGKTNRYALKAGRKTVHIQVANLDNKRYELNMYIEEVEATRMPMEAPFKLVEKWAVGVVYHQEYKGGDRTYFRADSAQKNTRWKGMSVDEIGGKQKKPKNNTADEKVAGWEVTPKNEIPKGLKEEVRD